jgi:capsid protein
MSDAMICTDLGADVDDVYQQLAQERALRAEYGLPEPQMMGAQGGGPGTADDGDEAGDDDDQDADPANADAEAET